MVTSCPLTPQRTHAQLPQHVDSASTHVLSDGRRGWRSSLRRRAASFEHGGAIAFSPPDSRRSPCLRGPADDLAISQRIPPSTLGMTFSGTEIASPGVQILAGAMKRFHRRWPRPDPRCRGYRRPAPAVADAAAHGGEGILPLDELQRLLVLALRRQLQVACTAMRGRTGVLQGAVPVSCS